MPSRLVSQFSYDLFSQSASATIASGAGAQVVTTSPRSIGPPARMRPVFGTPLRATGG